MEQNCNAQLTKLRCVIALLALLCLSAGAFAGPENSRASSIEGVIDRTGLDDGPVGSRSERPAAAAAVPEDAYWSNQFHALDFNVNGLYLDGSEGVEALYVWNDQLIIGGQFLDIEGDTYNRLAAWDGERLHALGGGVPGMYSSYAINAMIEFGGDLIVAGQFDDAGGLFDVGSIARWDGTNWYAMDNGFLEMTGFTIGTVRDLVIYDGLLIASGDVWIAGEDMGGIMVWDGSNWSPLGGGADHSVNDMWIEGGNLYAVGSFTEIGGSSISYAAYWDGSTWHSMGYTGSSLVCGTAYGADAFTSDNLNIYRWDGVDWHVTPGGYSVHKLAVASGELYSLRRTIQYTYGDGSIQHWSGTEWDIVESFADDADYEGAWAIIEYKGKALLGGYFYSVGGTITEHLAYFDGSSFETLGMGLRWADGDPFCNAFGEHEGELLVGGYYTSAGSTDVSCLASWDGEQFTPVGGDLNGSVWCITHYGTDLIVGGVFTNANGTSANRIASWDGATWSALGSGFTDGVRDVIEYDGDLYACGNFNFGTGDAHQYIARWDGDLWWPMDIGTDDAVYSMCVWDGKLIACGRFMTAGSITSPHLAMWDGAAWSALETDIDANVYCAIDWNGDLVIGGWFTQVGGSSIEGMARYDGSAWHSMDFPANHAAWMITPFESRLHYIGFEKVDPIYPNIVGYYTGSMHYELGSGIDPTESFLLDLFAWDNKLWVGSADMTFAGEKPVSGLTYWAPDEDGDGFLGLDDNCPSDYNPGQEDDDTDGAGDVCDNCPVDLNIDQADADYDELGDVCDNCLYVQNSGQENPDGDEYGSACDNCPEVDNPNQDDSDSDEVGDLCDNCVDVPNPGQEDADMDGTGDACELGCCDGEQRGDVNLSGGVPDLPTIGDISAMVDAKFISSTCGPKPGETEPIIACMDEADVNASAIGEPACEDVTIGDISLLVDYLFITGPFNWSDVKEDEFNGYFITGEGKLRPCP